MQAIELPSIHMLVTFISASFLLAIVPGPSVIFVLARTLSQGRRAGFASIFGVALGNLCNAAGSALGLAALFSVSSSAFLLVKYAGALYLLYLGILAMRPKMIATSNATLLKVSVKEIFRDGYLVALLNPKTALFFAAFLPQFIKPSASFGVQSVYLSAIFVLIAAMIDVVYVLTASALYPKITSGGNSFSTIGRYLTAGSFFLLAAFAALTDIKIL